MRFQFCKNSVFSILFLFSFLIGTICGVLLFRAVHVLHPGWITDYVVALTQVPLDGIFSRPLIIIVPFLLLFLMGLFSEGYRFVPLLAVVRGCLLSYFLSCCFVGGVGSFGILMRNMIFLPVFYLFSRYIWVNCPVDRYKL